MVFGRITSAVLAIGAVMVLLSALFWVMSPQNTPSKDTGDFTLKEETDTPQVTLENAAEPDPFHDTTFNALQMERGTRSNGEFDMVLKWIDGYGTVMGYLSSVKCADVDNDGEVEYVFGNREGYVYVLQNGPEGLSEEWHVMLGLYAYGLSLADVDNDGTTEIVVGDSEGYINIFGFNGTTYAREWKSQDLGSDLFGLKTADIDDDGTIEIIAGTSVSVLFEDNLFVYSWTGSAYEEEWSYAITLTLGYLGLFNIAVGDVDGDGEKEVVVASYETEVLSNDPPVSPVPPNPRGNSQRGGRFYVFPNTGGLPEWQSDDFGEWILGLGIGDTDGDDRLEIVISLYYADVYVFKYQTLTTIYSEVWSEAVGSYALTVGDIDNDDMEEIVVSSYYNAYVYKNAGPEDQYIRIWDSGNLGNYIYGLGTGYFDDDQFREILLGSETKLFVYGYNGTSFSMEAESDNLGAVDSITSADLDGDGVAEVFMGTAAGQVLVLGFDGTTWKQEDIISVASRTITHLAVADVDGDGVDELIAVEGNATVSWNENFIFRISSGHSSVYILGYSGSYVQEDKIHIVQSATFAVDVGDVDDDGIPEILLGGTGYDEDPFVGQAEVVDYDGQNYTIFWRSPFYREWTMGVAIGDVDGDGETEFVTEDAYEDENGDVHYVLRVYRWNGNTYALTATIEIVVEEYAENYALDVCDIDSDGTEEIVSKSIFSGPLDVYGWTGSGYTREWRNEQYTTFIDECFANTNLDAGERSYMIFGELGVFVYQHMGSDYQQVWHTAEIPASIKTLHLGNVDSISGKEIIGSSGGYNFIYGAIKLPVAAFNTSNAIVVIGDEIALNATPSKGEGTLQYFMDFGDGSDTGGWVSNPVVDHFYSDTGTYTVKLWVRDSRFLESTTYATTTVEVWPQNKVPRAEIKEISPNPAEEGEAVTFVGLGEDDDGKIVAAEWTSSIDGNLSTKNTFLSQSLSLGTHTIRFRVKDDRGDWSKFDSYTLRVEKKNPHPVAVIDSVSPNPALEGEIITFSGHGTDDGFITGYDWESNLDGFLSSKDFFVESSLSAGEHTISFRVKDNKEVWSEEVKVTLTVMELPENVAPVAVIDSILPSSLTEGESVTFLGHGEDDDGSIVSYTWESDLDGPLSDSRTFRTEDLSSGTHMITFRVRDDRDTRSKPVTMTIVVEEEEEEPPLFEFDAPEPFKDEPWLLWLLILVVVIIIIVAIAAAAMRKGKVVEVEPYYAPQGGQRYYRQR